eukprot:TRINITY_DN14796_c0_g1_i1.p1 TRINITY_DN14796_c0_g1~~TRINITY_DN14796_c0_g1_i1.p1  ORF type:complete len:166 (-),score=42.09 TRINITY_DN14796_c0_g1_i1:102-572(-)
MRRCNRVVLSRATRASSCYSYQASNNRRWISSDQLTKNIHAQEVTIDEMLELQINRAQQKQRERREVNRQALIKPVHIHGAHNSGDYPEGIVVKQTLYGDVHITETLPDVQPVSIGIKGVSGCETITSNCSSNAPKGVNVKSTKGDPTLPGAKNKH